MHLFDEATGDFNFPDLKKFLPDVDVAVINLAIRHQGLIVQKGNPLNIRGVADLGRKDVRFINRQRGAGTRILLDWHLKEAGMQPAEVAGYDKEESTHMAVAVHVLTGAAQCGMGIFAAAHALDISFVPLARERYDLVIPTKFLSDPRIAAMLDLIRSKDFQARIEALGGYETRLSGQQMKPGMGLG
jgi:putative molybdopterin biosynthesis protein